MELFILFEKKKKKPSIKYILLKKLENGFEALVVISLFNLARVGIINLDKFPKEIVLKWIGYLGAGILVLAVVIGVVWILIQLNKKLLTK